jgi:hypothetical protein
MDRNESHAPWTCGASISMPMVTSGEAFETKLFTGELKDNFLEFVENALVVGAISPVGVDATISQNYNGKVSGYNLRSENVSTYRAPHFHTR